MPPKKRTREEVDGWLENLRREFVDLAQQVEPLRNRYEYFKALANEGKPEFLPSEALCHQRYLDAKDAAEEARVRYEQAYSHMLDHRERQNRSTAYRREHGESARATARREEEIGGMAARENWRPNYVDLDTGAVYGPRGAIVARRAVYPFTPMELGLLRRHIEEIRQTEHERPSVKAALRARHLREWEDLMVTEATVVWERMQQYGAMYGSNAFDRLRDPVNRHRRAYPDDFGQGSEVFPGVGPAPPPRELPRRANAGESDDEEGQE